eukprot:2472986-Rhodomonas_salina.1
MHERVVQLTAIKKGAPERYDDEIGAPFDEPSVFLIVEEKSSGTKTTSLSISTAYKTSIQADIIWNANVELGGKFEEAWKSEVDTRTFDRSNL